MKKIYVLAVLFFLSLSVNSQSSQVSLGGAQTTSTFNSVKYDPNDGGTINAGYINDSSTGNGRDWYMVKLDKSQKVVWQKTIKNAGDDFIYKVIVCKNGDYVAVGVLAQNGIPRGFICRVKSLTGKIKWSTITNNTSVGEICYDVIETRKEKLAIAATDQWTNGPNSFIFLLNSAGKKIWSEISQSGLPDQPYSIGLLPNGNLIVGINEWVGSHYNLILTEMADSSGKVVNENSYSINTTIPNSSLNINSIASWGFNLIHGEVTLYCYAFQGATSNSSMCIYKYNPVSKKLSGNIYYHANDMNNTAFSYTPVNKNDYLVSYSYANPNRVYLSRVIDGVVSYDDLINNTTTAIKALDTTQTGAVFAGSANLNNHVNTQNLLTTRTDPAINSSCNITSSNTLLLQSSVLDATPVTDILFNAGGVLDSASLLNNKSSYVLTNVCGNILPVTLLNFNASINKLNNSALLTWRTTNEINNNFFEIDHSIDGKVFNSIGTVKNQNGSSITSYSFTDASPSHGLNFYRLKQVDKDGVYNYSKVVSVDLEEMLSFAVYPNPSSSKISLIIPNSSKTSTLILYDLNGKKIMTQQLAAQINSKEIDISKIAKGVYNLMLLQDGQTFSLKLVKN